ncbi:MAG TPA: adenine phosphoribosyltransferase [Bacteroidota bacterium]|nr:adenine phosphoribosyltransferase [Bacteroidota bacterium]
MKESQTLVASIRSVPDFPKKGIVFRDITTLLMNKEAYRMYIDILYDRYRDQRIDKVVGIESRGFVAGGALAYRLGAGFVPVRKPGKLPAEKIRQEYQLEYGTDAVEIHRDAIAKGERVLMHDDLLATGGTIEAACKLVEQLGGKIISLSFLIELSFLNPRKRLSQYDIFSLISYDSE